MRYKEFLIEFSYLSIISCILYMLMYLMGDQIIRQYLLYMVAGSLLFSFSVSFLDAWRNRPKEIVKINHYLDVRLIRKNTIVYVNNRKIFPILLSFFMKSSEINYSFNSYDERIAFYKRTGEKRKSCKETGIDAYQHFQIVSFMLKQWCKHNYNTQLLPKEVVFPLLKELSVVGASNTNLAHEIKKRFAELLPSVQMYLIQENYWDYLKQKDQDELMELGINWQVLFELEKYYRQKNDNTRARKAAWRAFMLTIHDPITNQIKEEMFSEWDD